MVKHNKIIEKINNKEISIATNQRYIKVVKYKNLFNIYLFLKR